MRADEHGRTRIGQLRQSGSTKLVFPRQHEAAIEAILVNTAGGITGDDVFTAEAEVQTNAALTVTTQAAERAYRAQDGETGRVTTSLAVQKGARLNWMPQELILFDQSALQRRLTIRLEDTAELLMVEPIVFGRAAMGETLQDIRFRDRIAIWRNGRPLYIDGMRLSGDAAAHLGRRSIANGAGAMASVVLVRQDAATQLTAVRAALPASAGASLIADDVLVIRHLASDSFELRRDLIPLLERLNNNTLPMSWRL